MLLLVMPQRLSAQQASVYTQYVFNGLVINPAYAGSHDALSASSIVRKQWVGTGGSPFASTFTIHSPVNKKKVSWGGLLYQSKTAIYSELSLQAVYAYRIDFSETRKLSLGLAGGFTNYAIRYSLLSQQNPNDPSIPVRDAHSFQPDVSAGAYYFTKTFFCGLSAQNLTAWAYRLSDQNDIRAYQHLFFSTGKVFDLSPHVKLKPSLLLHYYTRSPLLWDANVHALVHDVIWLGVSYRHNVSLNYMVRFNLTQQLSMGYSFDQSLPQRAVAKSGTHEIVLSYLFKYYKKNMVSPRYF
jgi:type IX secretion system PorP/SprF family membrane protein